MKIMDINPFVRQALFIKLGKLCDNPYRTVKTKDCRLFYITGGKGVIVIDGVEHRLCTGTCVILKAGTAYMFKPDEDSAITLIVANFDYTHNGAYIRETFSPVPTENFCTAQITDAVEFGDCEILNKPVVLHNAHILEDRMRLIVTERQIGNKLCDELLSSTLKSVILSAVRLLDNVVGASGTKQSTLVRNIIEHIQNHYSEPLTSSDLTKLFHYNAIYINRVFKKHTGSTVQQFLTDYRLKMSAELLKSSESPISDIAALTGFDDLSYFSKLFKKLYGVSPSHYRMKM